MNTISTLKKCLDVNIYSRKDKNEVIRSFLDLDVEVSKTVKEFFLNFEGPFWEETLGLELLDIIEEERSITSLTNICRKEYFFPKQYLILTDMVANEVLVLNTTNDKVYRVNFEGGDKLLLDEQLEECWGSFEQFLVEYFDL